MGEDENKKVWDLHLDAYAPGEIARRVERLGTTKVKLNLWTLLALSIMAGAFIAFGAELSTIVTHDSHLGVGLTSLLSGLTFSLGLILVVIAGAELFTGNTLIIMAYLQRDISGHQLLRNWAIVFLGNLLGALSLVFLIFLSRQYTIDHNLVGAKALLIANSKVNLPFLAAFTRGILCNILVTLAVWLAIGGRHVVDKITAILFPITAFVASGFEHSIANMYFIPIGMLLKQNPAIVLLAERTGNTTIDPFRLSMSGFLANLIPVTLGNIVGGVLFVGFAYWFVYLRPPVISSRSSR
ncbi:MAG: formate/nitrite transporter family protein, partial [Bacillota bacterium]